MNFKDTVLPTNLIVDLYKNVLIDDGSNNVVKDSKPNSSIAFLGDNVKKVVVVVNDASSKFINDSHLQFLTNILAACKLTLIDIALVNIAENKVDYTAIKKQLDPDFLLLFGVVAADIKMTFMFPSYSLQNFDNCKMLLAAPINKMLGNLPEVKTEKTLLWSCLQQMFGL
jgi:hypothetical protein